MPAIQSPPEDSQRLDRWLWASRQFKSRSIAVHAIENGRVELNGLRAKPAKLVHINDAIRIRRPPYDYDIIVRGLSGNRVSAKLAAALYEETPDSLSTRASLRESLDLSAVHEDRRSGKPDKKERRERENLKRSYE